MVRSLWKGKYINIDFTHNWFLYLSEKKVIKLEKNNQYLFNEFKNLEFNVYKGGLIKFGALWKSFFITTYHIGFISGVFLMNRETNVIHNVKKSKKQRAREQVIMAKKRKNKSGKQNILQKKKTIKKKDKMKYKQLKFN